MQPCQEPAFRQYRRSLPHWRASGVAYFVTWRLHPRQEPLCDAERTAVVQALRFFDGTRYRLLAAVVMPDHVHVLVQPVEGATLEGTVHSWKTWTGRLMCREFGRRAPVWQDEYFDRIVRDRRELEATQDYIEGNAAREEGTGGEYPWLCRPA